MADIVLSSRELIWGGGEVFLHSLGSVLRERGHTVRWRVPEGSQLARRVGDVDLLPRRRPAACDIVVANDFRSVWESIVLDRGVKRKFVVHGDWQLSLVRARIVDRFHVEPFGVSRQVQRAAIGAGLRSAMTILPLGPDMETSTNAVPAPSPRSDGFTLGCIARWDEVKRVGLFCEVTRALGTRGTLLAPVPSSARELEMAVHVGNFPEIELIHGSAADLWSRCEIFLSTSRSESLGLAHLEALAAGKLVLSTAQDGPEDFLVGPLAIGRLNSEDPEGLAVEVQNAIELAIDTWAGYSESAARILAMRGPRHCADQIVSAPW